MYFACLAGSFSKPPKLNLFGNSSFYKSFSTSAEAKNSRAFEVNRRAVLATRNVGIGHQGLVRFTCAMNMLLPMNENVYRDHVQAMRDAAEHTAKKSMSKAADKVKECYEPHKE